MDGRVGNYMYPTMPGKPLSNEHVMYAYQLCTCNAQIVLDVELALHVHVCTLETILVTVAFKL